MKKKKNKINTERFTIQFILCGFYIFFLFFIIFTIYSEYYNIKPVSFRDAESTMDYAHIDASSMSSKFAYYEDTSVGLHFVIEKEETGIWHLYVVAINEQEKDQYQELMEGKKRQDLYGYPVEIDESLKKVILHNIGDYIPKGNEIQITEDNYKEYLSNSYLDTTKKKNYVIDIRLLILSILFISILLLFILTIYNSDPFVDYIYHFYKRRKKQ